MEEALHWPSAFLSGSEFQHVARAVNLGSLWAAFDVDIAQALKRIKLTRRTFNARKLQGLRIIETELIRRIGRPGLAPVTCSFDGSVHFLEPLFAVALSEPRPAG